MQLYDLQPTAATTGALTSALSCNLTSALEVDAVFKCTGTYLFDQASFEAGTKNVTSAFTSANYTGEVASNMVSTTPIEAPSVRAAIKLSTCTQPVNAGEAPRIA